MWGRWAYWKARQTRGKKVFLLTLTLVTHALTCWCYVHKICVLRGALWCTYNPRYLVFKFQAWPEGCLETVSRRSYVLPKGLFRRQIGIGRRRQFLWAFTFMTPHLEVEVLPVPPWALDWWYAIRHGKCWKVAFSVLSTFSLLFTLSTCLIKRILWEPPPSDNKCHLICQEWQLAGKKKSEKFLFQGRGRRLQVFSKVAQASLHSTYQTWTLMRELMIATRRFDIAKPLTVNVTSI